MTIDLAGMRATANDALLPISKVGGGKKKTPGRYLIWSNYHSAWHRRGASGSAQGYSTILEDAGLFDWDIARHYNDGKRGRDRLIAPKELRAHVQARAAVLEASAANLREITADFQARSLIQETTND